MFVIDPNAEVIAVREARRMGIPVVAIVDTNCDPNLVDWVIPGNDDALRAIRLFTSKISDAVVAGRQSFEQTQIADQKAGEGVAGRRGRRIRGHQRLRRVREAGRRLRRRRRGARRSPRTSPADDEGAAAAVSRSDGASTLAAASPHAAAIAATPDHQNSRTKGIEHSHGDRTGRSKQQVTVRATREGAARPHRRGLLRLPRRAGRSRRRHRAGHQRPAQEGPGGRREESAARDVRRPGQPATFTPAARSACSSKINCESDFVARTEDFQQLCATTWPCTSPRSIRASCAARK